MRAAAALLRRAGLEEGDLACGPHPPMRSAEAQRLAAAGQSPRAIRAYRITITRAPEGTFVASENLKLPAALGTRMEEDVHRWAKGQAGCNAPGAETWPVLETKGDDTPTGALPAAVVVPQKTR